ncbi:MAG: hypothetical protein ACP5T4_01750 [Candidatus Micrarchaeia archaeon]
MEKTKISEILFLISGILILINSVLEFFFFAMLKQLTSAPNSNITINATSIAVLSKLGPALYVFPILGIISGLLLLLVGYEVPRNRSHVKVLGLAGILLSFLGIAGNGGFFIGFLIGIAGGIEALLA